MFIPYSCTIQNNLEIQYVLQVFLKFIASIVQNVDFDRLVYFVAPIHAI